MIGTAGGSCGAVRTQGTDTAAGCQCPCYDRRVSIEPHRLAEARSLAAHRWIADHLDRAMLDAARARVVGWLKTGEVHRHYAQRWQLLLEGDHEQLVAALTDPSEDGRALRQCTPFAGSLPARTRWRIWAEVRERLATG